MGYDYLFFGVCKEKSHRLWLLSIHFKILHTSVCIPFFWLPWASPISASTNTQSKIDGYCYDKRTWCHTMYVSPHTGTGPVRELGPIFHPVLELGLWHPHTGTVPLWGFQFQHWASHCGTYSLTPIISLTLLWWCQYGYVSVPVPALDEKSVPVPALDQCQYGAQHVHKLSISTLQNLIYLNMNVWKPPSQWL